MNPDLLQRFYQHVLERNGELYPPLTSQHLEQFSEHHDSQLPSILQDLYLISNGTGYDDAFMNRFLPLEELRFSESSVFGKVIWFFEYCIFSQVWGIVVSSGQVIDWDDRLVTGSISDFLEKYIDHEIQCA
jgi:hypothetical protein